MKKILLFVTVLCVAASNSFAQGFQAALQDPGLQELTETCSGGAPLNDTYTVKIYWDNDSNGPDDDDPQPVVGEGFGEYNINQFAMSGEYGDGYFGGASTPDFTCPATVPTPSKYFLRICLGGTEHWRSDTFSVIAGYQSIYFGPGGTETLTCLSSACPGCPSPAQITGFNADTTCHNQPIHLTWSAYNDVNADSLELTRNSVVIAMLVKTFAPPYNDATAPNGDVNYLLRARRTCAPGVYGFSNPANDIGYHTPPLPAANLDTVITQCDSVDVQFDNPANVAGVTGFRIKRNGVQIGDTASQGSSGQPNRIFRRPVSVAGAGDFTVVPYGPACGEGTISNTKTGSANISPPQVQNVQATDTLCAETITWNDVDGNDGYRIYWAASPTPPTTLAGTVTDPNGIIFVHTGAPINQALLYKVVAYTDLCGNGPDSGTDLGYRLAPPNAPTSVAATDNTLCDRVTITWTDNSANETGFKIVRDADTIATAVAASPYDDLTGTPGQIYLYKVIAYNTCGNSTVGVNQDDNGTRKGVPGQVLGVSATDNQASQVTVTWTDLAGTYPETGYDVLRNGVVLAAGDNLAAGTVLFNDLTAAAGQVYLYQVQGFNECGPGLAAVGDSGRVVAALSAPFNVNASDSAFCTHVAVTWNDTNSVETGFKIFRNTTLATIDTFNAPANATSYNDSTATAGTTYAYSVKAVNGATFGPLSNIDNGSKKPVPVAPVLAVTDQGCDSVCFSWAAVPGADDYVLYKDGSPVDTVAGTSVCYGTGGDDTSHNYTLKAKNNCGQSLASNSIAAQTISAPVAPTNLLGASDDCETVVLTWDDPALAALIKIYRGDFLIDSLSPAIEVYTDTVAPGDHVYNVTGVNQCGEGPQSADANITVAAPPTAPTSLAASDTSCQAIYLTWTAGVDDDFGYQIYRDAAPLASTPGGVTAYTDNTATEGEHEYYVYTQGGNCADSDTSNHATGTRLPSTGIPAGVTATDDRCSDIAICWTSALGTVDYYVIYRGIDSVGTSAINCFVDIPDPGTYTYTVKAFSAACGYGGVSNSDEGTRVTQSTAPTTYAASQNRCDSIVVTWSPASGSFSNYNLLRNGTSIFTGDDTSYVDGGADLGDNEYKLFTEQLDFACENSDTVTMTGTKLPAPTAPTDFVASDTSCTAIYMTWTASSGTFDEYYVYEDGTQIATVPAPTTSYAHVTATPGATTAYWVTAHDTVCGESDESNHDDGLRVLGPDAPTDLTASSDDCETVHLEWTASVGDVSNYKIFSDGDLIETISSAFTAFDDSFAVAGVTHEYYVTAVSAFCGETLPSDTVEGLKLPQMPQVENLTASSDECAGVVLNWDDIAGADLYRIYRDGSLSPYDSVEVVIFLSTYTDTGTVFGDDHSYEVTAVNACGEGAASDTAVGARAALPDQVQGVVATDTICGEVCVTWTDLDGESAYIIYRDGIPGDTVGADTTESCDVTAVVGVTYDYSVAAMNGCGTGPQSATDPGTSIQSLDAVDDLVATTTGCDSVGLTWTDITGETGYRVYKQNVPLIDLPADQTSYADYAIDAGTCRIYRVHGFNECGEGPLGNEPNGCRRAIPSEAATVQATSTLCTHVQINWSGIVDADSIRVVRNSVTIRTVGGGESQFNDSTGTAGVQYLYSVFGFNPCGSADTSFTTPGARANVPLQVQNLTATDDLCFKIRLDWTDLIVEAGYRVYRDADTTNPIATLGANVVTYIDSPRVGAYQYRVRGFNDCGSGPLSVSMQGEGLTVPSQVSGVAASVDCGIVTVSWDVLGGTSGYRIYRVGTPDILIGTNPEGDGDFQDTPGTGTWHYYVFAFNGCGDAVHSDTVQAIVPPTLGQVTGVALNDSCTCIRIHWTALTGAASYTIYCDSDSVGTSNTTQYFDCSGPGVCNYTVAGRNTCGYGIPSAPVEGEILGIPETIDASDFVSTDILCDRIEITWLVNADADTFVLSYFEGAIIDTYIVADGITFPIIDNPPCGIYTYQLRIMNECGDAINVPTSNGTRPCPPATVDVLSASDNLCDRITVTWENSPNESFFDIFRTPGDSLTTVGVNVTTYDDFSAVAGVSYEYVVRARNNCGFIGFGDPDTGIRLAVPSVPTNVHADDGCGVITVFWDASTGDVDNYAIRRDGGAPVLDNASPYPDNTATPGQHSYTVEAISNECTDSGQSPADNGTNHVIPGAPTSLAASDTGCTVVLVNGWTISGETDSVTIYKDGDSLARLDNSVTSYVDADVLDNDTHDYQISAYNEFCDGSSNLSPLTTGRLLDLLTINSAIPDTVYCDSTYDVDIDLCAGIDSVRILLSLNGGPYTAVGTIPTPTDITEIQVPHPNELENPNSHLRLISHRGVRQDTATTNAFRLDCDLAVDGDISGVPQEFYLTQNYPNPFNPSTTIEFGVPKLSYVSIEVYDLTGRLVATPLSGTVEPGIRMITWDCSDCATGMYLLRMATEAGVLQKKMLLMK